MAGESFVKNDKAKENKEKKSAECEEYSEQWYLHMMGVGKARRRSSDDISHLSPQWQQWVITRLATIPDDVAAIANIDKHRYDGTSVSALVVENEEKIDEKAIDQGSEKRNN